MCTVGNMGVNYVKHYNTMESMDQSYGKCGSGKEKMYSVWNIEKSYKKHYV